MSLPLDWSDPDGDPITFDSTVLPDGLTLNHSTGLISGTLSAASAGSYTVTVSVMDSGGETAL